jgi:peptide/nickel transport system permease protein
MLTYTLRRLLSAIPTLLMISFVIFLIVDLAPGSPMSEIPLTVPVEIRLKMMAAMGADKPMLFRYVLWLRQFFWIEPMYALDGWFGTDWAGGAQRILSWQSKVPVFQIIGERMPQTLTVVGSAYLVGVLIALPIGIYSAYRQYSWFDQAGTFFSMVGFSVPTFFTGNLLILI